MCSFETYSKWSASIDTHTRAQCSHAISVGLAQARPDETVHSRCCDVFFNLQMCHVKKSSIGNTLSKKGVMMPVKI